MASAIGVLVRGMRDNPLHVAALGPDPERRVRGLQRIFRTLFRVMDAQRPIAALDGETLLGVTGDAPPGTCRPTASQRMRYLPSMVAAGPRTSARVGKWVSTWAKHDPDEPHSHLGPLAVDAHLQGRGIGSLIMGEYTRRLDEARLLGYLETDRPENVPFYEKHGFVVVGEAPVIGVPNWFMQRRPAKT
jgi:GNAT superfamily N-acetyltransferase